MFKNSFCQVLDCIRFEHMNLNFSTVIKKHSNSSKKSSGLQDFASRNHGGVSSNQIP